jgi:WD40 repeat protein
VDIPGGWLREAAFSADGGMLAVAGWDDRVSLLDVTDPRGPRALGGFDVPLPALTSMTFSPDGRSLALLEMDRIKVWNVANPARPAPLGEAGGFYVNKQRLASFHPDGHTVAVPARHSVVLFGVTGRPALTRVAELPSGSPMVYSVAFSPDGRTMASGQFDRKVILWDVSDLAKRKPSRIGILATNTSLVESVTFSPDGHSLVASAAAQTLTLWDVTDRNAPVRYPATSRYRPSVGGDLVIFSPDGHTVALTGNSSVSSPDIQLWDYSELNGVRADPVRHACAIADRGLTAEEWALFVPERQYRRSCG